MPHRLGRSGHLLPRHRTVLGGVALALVLLTALTLLGVLGARQSAPPTQAILIADADTRTAVQPVLKAALLRPEGLPDNYISQHTAANRPSARPYRQPERCAALLGAPDDLLRGAAATIGPVPSASAQATARHAGPAGALLNQVLTTFSDSDAGTAFDELRRVGRRCRDFGAVLQDGTAVRVRVEEVPRDQMPGQLLQLQGESFALKLTVTGGAQTMTGCLALAHAGRLLSVLRQLEPEQTGSQDSSLGLLDAAARKLALLPPS